MTAFGAIEFFQLFFRQYYLLKKSEYFFYQMHGNWRLVELSIIDSRVILAEILTTF